MKIDEITTANGEIISTYTSIPLDQIRRIHGLVRCARVKEAEDIARAYPGYTELQIKQLLGYTYEVITTRLSSEGSALSRFWWKMSSRKT